MKKYIAILLAYLSISIQLFGQKHDNNWVMGYSFGNPHPDIGRIVLEFKDESLISHEGNRIINIFAASAAVSNYNGELLFYTNGIDIVDSTHQIMENGNSITDVDFTLQSSGLNVPQAVLILPSPNNDSLYYLFHEPVDFESGGLGVFFPELSHSIINTNENGGLGKVVVKNEQIIQDTLAGGKLTATKHANGRDWWIIIPECEELINYYHTILLTPEGVVNMGIQSPGPGLEFEVSSVGNALFSPDGTKYVRQDIRFDPWNAIDIYDFDRCTGMLAHLEHFEVNDTSFLYGGAAVSSDSKYLYVVTNQKIWQYDLQASEIEPTATLVGEFDGYVGYWFPSFFGTPQIGPDGKIYIASAVGDTVMHVINTPNHYGMASHLAQHSISLPNLNDKSIPNFPNYRLGPLDGSPCDTLGLDNHPLAGFTYFAEELAVTFSDNSYYRPEEWGWDFGDGSSSTERNPVHSYGAPGEYHVCLTVRNEIDEDTYCRNIQLDTMMVVGTLEAGEVGKASVFPNPASGQFNLQFDLPGTGVVTFSLHDVAGRQVRAWDLPGGKGYFTLPLFGVAEGMYFWRVASGGRFWAVGS